MEKEEISRREALGLFKAMAVLGAGLMIGSRALGEQKPTGDAYQLKMDGIVGPDFECRFYVVSDKTSALFLKYENSRRPMMFTVKLPADMVRLLQADSRANVQIKLFATHLKYERQFGSAQIKIEQGVLQSKQFLIQDKWVPAVEGKMELPAVQGKVSPQPN